MKKFNEEVMLDSIVKKLANIDSHISSFDQWCGIVNSFTEAKTAGIYLCNSRSVGSVSRLRSIIYVFNL
ncbi:hypothetical protein B2I23_05445 [Candidatus Liberibacter asiaticus]|nr:hypothetical protein B2I23_05445 [Candidatus Liberibacter asiaticus]RKL52256.1 hypothetical protein D2A38_05630 [Candidatus Liberibacter asiaticus]